MNLTFPKVGLAVLLVFAFLIRDDLFPSHDQTHAEPGAEAPASVEQHADSQGGGEPETPPPAAGEKSVEVVAPAVEAPAEPVSKATEPSVSTAAERASDAGTPAIPVAAPPAGADVAQTGAAQEWSVTEYWVAARTAFALGDMRRAREEYAQVLSNEPGNWYAHEELGNVYARTNQLDKAVHHYQRASLLLVGAGRYEDARRIALRMAQLYPNWKDRVPEGLADR